MRGSLESPPIVVRASRLRTLLSLALLVAAVGYLIVRLGETWSDDEHAEVFMLLGGAVITLFLLDVLRPSRLVLDWRGLSQSRLWRTRRWSWDEVTEFRVLSKAGGRCVGFDYSVGRGDMRFEGQDSPLGADATLNGGWEMGPQRLARLLNEAKVRWTEGQAPD